jgi:membrane peptidoglycan carboxypeptidase
VSGFVRTPGYPPAPAPRRRASGSIALLLIGATLVSALAGVATGRTVVDAALAYLARTTVDLPQVGVLSGFGLPRTNRFYARDGVTLLALRVSGEEDRDWTPYAALPPRFIEALIATEDRTFFENSGTDFAAILRSALTNAAAGEVVGGGSTITQQLVKRLVLSDAQTVERKLREIAIASDVANNLSKEQVLELYVNSVFYGNGAYSPEAAARRYFGTSLAELNLTQLALLAGLPKAPDSLNPIVNPEAARGRMQVVLNALLRDGKISDAERDAAAVADFGLVPYVSPLPVAPWFTEAAEREAIAILGEEAYRSCGCAFTTTLDPVLQPLAQAAVTETIAKLDKRAKAKNSALVAEDPATGDILAYVGSVDPLSTDPKVQGQYDSAGVGRRQPGSSWKPIAYLAAIEDGAFNSATSVWDVSTEFAPAFGENPAYRPDDYWRDQVGLITIRQSLRESRNIPVIRAMLATSGVEGMIDMANRLGIEQEILASQSGPAAALGTTSVTLREMVQAYSTIATLGAKLPSRTLLQISRTGDAAPLYLAPTPVPQQVVDPKHAFTLVDILRDNATSRSWLTGARGNIGRPAILKTGTASEVRDTYTMGGTPNLIVGVWTGNADNSAMNGSFGSISGPLVIWSRFMKAAIKAKGESLPKLDWAAPAGMEQQELCTNVSTYGGWGWNRLATDGCPFGSAKVWVIPGFNDPATIAAADALTGIARPSYGTFFIDSRNRVVDPATCAVAREVTGLLAIAERPEWQADLEAWVGRIAENFAKNKRTYPWTSTTFVFPGDGLCDGGALPTPEPTPSPTPTPTPTPEVTPTPSLPLP